MAVDQLNTYDVVASDDVVFTRGAFDAFVGGTAAATERKAEADRRAVVEAEPRRPTARRSPRRRPPRRPAARRGTPRSCRRHRRLPRRRQGRRGRLGSRGLRDQGQRPVDEVPRPRWPLVRRDDRGVLVQDRRGRRGRRASLEAGKASVEATARGRGGRQVSTLHKDHRDVLIAPVVSEKSYGLLDANKYTFLVHPDANKTEIKIAVEKVFNVKVTASTRSTARARRGGPATGWASARTPSAPSSASPRATASTSSEDRFPDGHSQVQADHPGPSRLVGRRLRRDHPDHAGEVPDQAAAQEGRPQQPGPDHHPAPGRRPQARLPHHRLPALRQGRHPGQGRAHRVRPQPHRPDRAAALRRRREALHHRAEGPAPGCDGRVRRQRRHQDRQQPAAAPHPGRHHDPLRSSCGPVAAPRSPARPA